MRNDTATWCDYAHQLTPEQIRHCAAWAADPELFPEWSLSGCDWLRDPAALAEAHRRRLVALARDRYGALGPGRLN